MKPVDIAVIAVIAALAALSYYFLSRRQKNSGCCGCTKAENCCCKDKNSKACGKKQH